MSLLLLFGRQGAVTSGSGEAALNLELVGQGAATHVGTGIAALTLGLVGTGERPAAPGEHLGSGVAHLTLGLVGAGWRTAVSVDLEVWANLGPGDTWYNIAPDIIISSFGFNYGLTGNRPSDSLAGSGSLTFSIRNDELNSGNTVGWYSPLHASCRPGWTAGIEIFVWLAHEARIGATGFHASTQVVLVTAAPHGLAVGDFLRLDGATTEGYNFVWRVILVSDATTVWIDVGSAGSGPVAGTLTVQRGHVRFWGRVETIDPEPGRAFRRAHVTAYDRMRDLLDADLVDVALQINQTESEVMSAIFAALDSSVAPRRVSLDAGIDQVPIALDNLGDGTRAGAIVSDLLRSSYGIGAVIQDGLFLYVSRNTRATQGSSATLSSTMSGLSASTSLAKVYNEIKTTTHPRTIDAAPVVLYAATGTPSSIPASTTVEIEGTFRDPTDVLRLIGAASTETMVAGLDWIANSIEDGSGTDLTAWIAVTPTVRASTVVFTIVSTSGVPAYLTTLQIRGRGVYDNGPRTFTSTSVQPYGKRTYSLDLTYQPADAIGQQIADFVKVQYAPLGPQMDEIVLRASPDSSPVIFSQMMEREISHVVTITETQTGVSSIPAMILGVAFQALTHAAFEVRWRVGPVVTIDRPGTPTGLTVTTLHDTAVTVSWSTATAGSSTQVYMNGVYLTTAGIGVTAVNVYDLTPATNYSFTVRALYFGLTSDFSAAVVGRPSVVGTGGNSTFDSGGLRYHYFTSSGSFTMTVPGRITITGVGGGGGGGAYQDNTGTGGGPTGGGGGGGGRVEFLANEEEPAGVHAIVIGAGGIGAATLGQNGQIGGSTTYRVDHMICEGGGRGAGGSGAPNAGGTGGSGGGGAGTGGGSGGNNVGGAGLGFNGGNGGVNPGGAVGGGGGGGAGGAGGNATTIGGAGGAAYAGLAAGGVGGRGTSPAAGTANTGTGGGGGQESHPTGFAGGSGILYITYPI